MAEMKLNRQQQSAVHHRRGPLLIIAGAGTGKTTVVTERIKWLIDRKLARPDQILALTFTDKAAKEMEDRIDRALPYGYTQMWVMTFHSFCDRILRDEGLHIGLSPNYTLLTGTGTVALLKKHILNLNLNYFSPLGNPNKFISALLDHFDRLRDEDVSPAGYSAWVETAFSGVTTPEASQYRELSSAFTAFTQIKLQENCLDFADLISFTLQLFRTRPHLLAKYQDQFKYLLVDEYQDTNFAQNQLVDLLAEKNHNLTVVADDDQSIFRWRGAAVSNVIRFRDIYPHAKLISLTKNYRSSQAILDAAYRLIQNNNPDRLEIREKINKHLTSVIKDPGHPPQYLHFSRVDQEASGVADKISETLSENPQLHFRDFAILVRANAHAEVFSKAVARLGYPVQFLGPSRLFEHPEVKDLIALLKLIRDPNDSSAFFRVLSMDFFSLPVRDLITLSNLAPQHQLSLLQFCQKDGLFPPEISTATRSTIQKLTQTVNHLVDVSLKLSAGQIVYEFLQTTGILSAILTYQPTVDANTAENISLFFAKLKGYELENTIASVSAVLDWIDLSTEIGGSPLTGETDWTQNDAINILTLHAAKGLEFPVVFLVNLVSGRFPSIERKETLPIPASLVKEILPEGDFHLQEERRLFYVGLTRAVSRLFVTAADYYGEGKRQKKISPFVVETFGPQVLTPAVASVEQLALSDWKPPDFNSLSSSQTSPPPPKVTYLSYSQIQTFNDCPLHYKAKYLLKIPTPPSAASSFGNTIHKTMKDFYQSNLSGGKPDILDIFSQNWTPQGYLNPGHAQKYFDLGCRYLSEFTSQNPFTGSPVVLEQPFTFRLGDLKIGGKIDRADILADGTLEIIDYKTSTKMLDPKSAAKDLQLSFYALAATSIRTAPFNRQPSQVKLTLYYFSGHQSVSVVQTSDQLAAAKQEILNTARAIESSDFRCSGSIICRGKCDYQILCDSFLTS